MAHDYRYSYNIPGTDNDFWRALAAPCRQRESSLRSHDERATVASPPRPPTHTTYSSTVAVVESQRWGDCCPTRGHGRSRGSHPSFAYRWGEPPPRLAWRKDTSSIVFIVHLANNESISSLACDGRSRPSESSTVAVVDS